MERKKASDFPPEVLQLFDGFVHGRLSRRAFLDGAAKYAAGSFTAAAMLEALTPDFAWAQQVKPGDARINAGWPAFEKVLQAHHVKYEAHVYPNTQHGFHNDTTPRYDEAAAKLSWQRTLAFFAQNLRA